MDRINTAFMYVSAKCHHGFYDDAYSSPPTGRAEPMARPVFLAHAGLPRVRGATRNAEGPTGVIGGLDGSWSGARELYADSRALRKIRTLLPWP